MKPPLGPPIPITTLCAVQYFNHTDMTPALHLNGFFGPFLTHEIYMVKIKTK